MTPHHRESVLDIFVRIQEANGGAYPSKKILEESQYPPGRPGIQCWFDRDRGNQHFVFLRNEDDAVAGHIEIQPLSEHQLLGKNLFYWEKAFPKQSKSHTLTDLMVLKRFAVDPVWQGQDIGRQLLRHAIHKIENIPGKRPALVVLNVLQPAQRLYKSEGGQVAGKFNEVMGELIVSYIF